MNYGQAVSQQYWEREVEHNMNFSFRANGKIVRAQVTGTEYNILESSLYIEKLYEDKESSQPGLFLATTAEVFRKTRIFRFLGVSRKPDVRGNSYVYFSELKTREKTQRCSNNLNQKLRTDVMSKVELTTKIHG